MSDWLDASIACCSPEPRFYRLQSRSNFSVPVIVFSGTRAIADPTCPQSDPLYSSPSHATGFPSCTASAARLLIQDDEEQEWVSKRLGPSDDPDTLSFR